MTTSRTTRATKTIMGTKTISPRTTSTITRLTRSQRTGPPLRMTARKGQSTNGAGITMV